MTMRMQSERAFSILTRRQLRMIPEVVLAWLAWCMIPLLPRGCILGLARCSGVLGWRFSRRERKVSDANLDLVYGDHLSEQEKNRIGCHSFQTFALTLLDLFWFSRFTRSRYARYVRVDEKMRAVMQQHPLVGVTGHFGNWEILSMMYGMEGNPMTAVAMPLKNPFVDRMLCRLRNRSGSISVAREGAVRSLLRALRAGGVVGLVLDQNTCPEEGGVFVPFFGLPVAVSNAAGLLACKTKAPLAVAGVFPDNKGVYHVSVRDVFYPQGKDAETITAEVTACLEELVRQHPEHWLWSYKRWRYYRAQDDASAYPYYASCID